MKEPIATAQNEEADTKGLDEAAGSILDEAGPINENLFLDEDLEGLDDELNDLDLN